MPSGIKLDCGCEVNPDSCRVLPNYFSSSSDHSLGSYTNHPFLSKRYNSQSARDVPSILRDSSPSRLVEEKVPSYNHTSSTVESKEGRSVKLSAPSSLNEVIFRLRT